MNTIKLDYNTNPMILFINTNQSKRNKLLYQLIEFLRLSDNYKHIICIDRCKYPIQSLYAEKLYKMIISTFSDHCLNSDHDIFVILIIKQILTENNLNSLRIFESDDPDLATLMEFENTYTGKSIIYQTNNKNIGVLIDESNFLKLYSKIALVSNYTKTIYDFLDLPLHMYKQKISFNKICKMIELHTKIQIFTIASIYKILTNLFSIDSSISNLIDTHGSLQCYSIIQCIVQQWININKPLFVQKLQEQEREIKIIKNKLKNTNTSIRQIMFLYHGMKKTISKKDLIETLEKYKLDRFYHQLDDKQLIHIVHEIFYPLEEQDFAFCVIIPSYNNAKTFSKTLDSIFEQKYSHYRIIYVDDCSCSCSCSCSGSCSCSCSSSCSSSSSSSENEVNKVNDYVNICNQLDRTIIVSQEIRQRQCAGRYIAYHMAFDDEILLFIDGDDMLFSSNVMNIINNRYKKCDVVATYGSFLNKKNNLISNNLLGNEHFPQHVIRKKNYRFYKYISAHLRTGFAKLYKSINLKDLLDQNNEFYHILTDFAEMIPVLEMSTINDKIYFDSINEPLYIYNLDNSVKYNTSFIRQEEPFNYYKQYRDISAKRIRNCSKYFQLIKNKHNKPLSIMIVMMDDFVKPIDSKYSLDYRSFNQQHNHIPFPESNPYHHDFKYHIPNDINNIIQTDNHANNQSENLSDQSDNLRDNYSEYNCKYFLYIHTEPFVNNNIVYLDDMVEIMENYKLDALTTCSFDYKKFIFLSGKVIHGKIRKSYTLKAMINISKEQMIKIIDKGPVLIRSNKKIILTMGFIVWHNK